MRRRRARLRQGLPASGGLRCEIPRPHRLERGREALQGRGPDVSAAPALGLLSALLFGAATPAGKMLLGDFTPFQLAGLLYLGAAAGVAPVPGLYRSTTTA